MEDMFSNTSDQFRLFFPLGIPKYFRPDFYNVQFVTGHGNFGDFLFRIGAIDDPGCLCGKRKQDSSHLLLECPIFQNYRNRENIENKDIFMFTQSCARRSGCNLHSSHPRSLQGLSAGLRAPFRLNVHDEQRSGRPSFPESTVARIDEMVRANRRITLENIEDGLNEDCSHFSVHKIVSETLGYRKVSARWVDKWLKEAAGE
ncbi:hypothetical protein LAZ67_9000150 [Cordylochernes scorpioides]|uniref:Reverse transcriptase n=1 Tax=Cordylochernes scorpioides TaxID=51811 RepID=A0ABY6KST9_9ARAC|nr:hypothetical protein LAZ67_9000150 [Cordylochernes scorpioides]